MKAPGRPSRGVLFCRSQSFGYGTSRSLLVRLRRRLRGGTRAAEERVVELRSFRRRSGPSGGRRRALRRHPAAGFFVRARHALLELDHVVADSVLTGWLISFSFSPYAASSNCRHHHAAAERVFAAGLLGAGVVALLFGDGGEILALGEPARMSSAFFLACSSVRSSWGWRGRWSLVVETRMCRACTLPNSPGCSSKYFLSLASSPCMPVNTPGAGRAFAPPRTAQSICLRTAASWSLIFGSSSSLPALGSARPSPSSSGGVRRAAASRRVGRDLRLLLRRQPGHELLELAGRQLDLARAGDDGRGIDLRRRRTAWPCRRACPRVRPPPADAAKPAGSRSRHHRGDHRVPGSTMRLLRCRLTRSEISLGGIV